MLSVVCVDQLDQPQRQADSVDELSVVWLLSAEWVRLLPSWLDENADEQWQPQDVDDAL